jgi:hypothetical protein
MNDTAAAVHYLAAAKDLLERARKERGMEPMASPRRRFLLGVDAAALEALHPELAGARGEHWLERETHEFRDGYLKTRTALVDARGCTVPAPIQIP